VNTEDEVAYRAALAQGFLAEAEEDMGLQRWRSCVDNAQLAIENAGKSILGLFNIPSKTHDPAKGSLISCSGKRCLAQFGKTCRSYYLICSYWVPQNTF